MTDNKKNHSLNPYEISPVQHTIGMPYYTQQEILQQQQMMQYNYQQGCNYPNRKTNFLWSYIADWAFVLVMAVACAIWFADKPDTIWFRLDDPELWYPNIPHDTFPSSLLQALIWGVPILVFIIAQIWLRSVAEFHCTILAFVECVLMSYFVTTFLMWAVGGLRPSFLSECIPMANPVVTHQGDSNGHSPFNYFTKAICTNDASTVRTAQQSFPSGHAATIFSSFGFLVLYLNAKIKPFDGFAHAWKLIIFFPLAMATWISFSRVNDGKHFQFDVCAGIVIGLVIPLIAYKFNFCSLWGPTNHIPLRMTWVIDNTIQKGRIVLGQDYSQQTRQMFENREGHSFIHRDHIATNLVTPVNNPAAYPPVNPVNPPAAGMPSS